MYAKAFIGNVNKRLKPFFLEHHINIENRVTLQSFWFIFSCFERSWLLGNNRKLHFCLTLSVNYKIVHFEHLVKAITINLHIKRYPCFDKSVL